METTSLYLLIENNTNQTIGLFDRFCHNIKSTGNSNKVKVCQGTSEQILPKLLASGVLFDFCYIDGSHSAKVSSSTDNFSTSLC